MKFNRIHKEAKTIDGWLSKKEGELLFTLASKVDSMSMVVEVGCYKGLSSFYLASGSKAGKGAKVLSVDTFEGSEEHKKGGESVWTYNEFVENMKIHGVDDIVVPKKERSHEAAKNFKGKIGLLFIDASHDYSDVIDDFVSWTPFLGENCYVAMHDTIMWPGPKKTAEEKLFKSPDFVVCGFSHSITYAVKRNKRFYDYINGFFILQIKNLYETAVKAKRLFSSYFK